MAVTRPSHMTVYPATDPGGPPPPRSPIRKPPGVGALRVGALGLGLLLCAALAGCGADEPVVHTDHMTIDLVAKQVTVDGEVVRLTPTEWALLSELVRAPGRLVGQRQLLQKVWGPAYEKETHYLRVYMAQLRRKLEPDPARPRYLQTEPGMGYRFTP